MPDIFTYIPATKGRYYSRAPTEVVVAILTRTRALHMRLSGWGRYPTIETLQYRPATRPALVRVLVAQRGELLARGMGRSYGDASLAACSINMTGLDHFIAFDAESGALECSAGLTLAAILDVIVPRGWFLPVLPGTGFATLGGAIAADVHGKNHHRDGSFSQFVDEITVMLTDGSVVNCSRHTQPDLFHATAGGMGLTGVIVAARLRLRAISSSYIDERVIAAPDLAGVLTLLEQHQQSTYGVAWIDVNQAGGKRGRALLMLGEHATGGGLAPTSRRALSVPVEFPAGLLGRPLTRTFNALYYWRGARQSHMRRVHYSQYFFPLDALRHWHRLYGKRGFMQHQCVLPHASAPQALRELLTTVTLSGQSSPLAVLKRFGPGNDNLLSFPMDGLTLTMDFAMRPATLTLFARLDDIVVAHGGRLYLAKDACMSRHTFVHGSPHWQRFQEIREQYGAVGRFASLQSRRLGL